MRRCTSESEDQLKKTCVDCGTSKTPLWRSGPAGPKSLCNACGIKSRKRRKPSGSLSKENKKPKNESAFNSKSGDKDANISSDKGDSKSRDSSNRDKDESSNIDEMQDMVARIKMVLNGDSANDEGNSSRCDFSEEERAAIMLMALSYSIQ